MAPSIQELLEKDKWEVKAIAEIANSITSGNGVTKAQLGTGNYPAIRYSEIHKTNLFIGECESFVDPDLVKPRKYCEHGDIIITNVSENIQQVGKAAAYLGDRCLIGTHIFCIKHSQNPLFLACMFSSKYLRKQIERYCKMGTVIEIRKSIIPNLFIPLPPRHVQDLIGEFLYELIQSTKELSEKLKRENGDLDFTEMRS